MAIAVQWDIKAENHNNLVLFHTRNELVRDWLEDNTQARRDGTAYVIEATQLEPIRQALKSCGFVVE